VVRQALCVTQHREKLVNIFSEPMDHYAKPREVSKNGTDRAAALPFQEIVCLMQEQSR
jgi:hypothetical protein